MNHAGKIRETTRRLLEQGCEITLAVLKEKLAYMQGRADARSRQADSTLGNILHNTTLEIKQRMHTLYERNFYNVPSEEDKAEMRAYEFLLENLPLIVKEYKGGAALCPAEPGKGGK